MPDISMCAGHGCLKRSTCYRYRAIPTPGRQCYGDFHTHGKCDAYWPVQQGQRLAPIPAQEINPAQDIRP